MTQWNGCTGYRVLTGSVRASAVVAVLLLTVVPALAQTPVVGTASPLNGTGLPGTSQTLTFTAAYASTEIYPELNVLMSPQTFSAHACYFVAFYNSLYDGGAPTIYLFNDSATNWSPLRVGTSATQSNSHCQINGAQSSMSYVSGVLTVTVNVVFSNDWAGSTLRFFEEAVATSTYPYATSGWWQNPEATFGVIGPNLGPPVLGAALTGSSAAGSKQTLTFTTSDPNGWGAIDQMNIIVSPNHQGYQNCFLLYYPYVNRVYLFDDNVTDWTPINAGDYGAVGNSHCSVNGDGIGFTSVNNTTAKLSLSMTFTTSFLGTKYYDQYVADQLGNNSNWGTIPGTLTITPALNLSVGFSPSALVGVPFSQTLSGDATGGTPPYNWSATGLPPGMSFSPNGMLSGTPTASGTYYPAVTVTDSSITPARAGPTGYVVSVRFPPTIITSSQLQGLAGVPFSQSFAASGGVPPYTWSVQSGSTLPAGLTLSYAGTLSGTNGGGAFSFTIKLTDSNGISAAAPFSLSFGYFTVPQTINVTGPAGTPVTFPLAVTSVNGYFNSNIYFSSTCGNMSFSPNAVYFALADANHSKSVSVTLTSTGTTGCNVQATGAGASAYTIDNYAPSGSSQQDFFPSGPSNSVGLILGSSSSVQLPIGITAIGGFNSQVRFSSATPGFIVDGAGYPPGALINLSAPSGTGTSVSVTATGTTSTGTNLTHTFSIPVSLASGGVQQTITSIPSGLTMYIDGVACTSPCYPRWNAGSSHTIGTAATHSGGLGTQYVFPIWNDSGAMSHSVIAQATTLTYTATFTTQYQLTTSVSPAGAGILTVGPQNIWYSKGTTVTVGASPNSGFQFSGFGGGIGGTNPSASFAINAPMNVIANFTLAGQPDFSLTISPPPAPSGQISGNGFTITLNPVNGFSVPVNLTWTNSSSWPAGLSATFQQNQVVSGTSVSFTSPSTPPGNYTLSFSAVGGGVTHSYDIVIPAPDAKFYSDYGLIALDSGDVYAFFHTWADDGSDAEFALTQVQNATVTGPRSFGGLTWSAPIGLGAVGSSGKFDNFTLSPNSFGLYTFSFDYAMACCSPFPIWWPTPTHYSSPATNYPAPHIDSVSAQYASPGDKLDGVNITGNGLGIRSADLTTNYGVTEVSIRGNGCPNADSNICGVTAYPELVPVQDTNTVPTPPATSVKAYISLSGNAKSGTYYLRVKAFGADSNEVSFTVADRTPYIDHIEQTDLQPGQSGQIKIYGANFGQACGFGQPCPGAGVAICKSGAEECASSEAIPTVSSWSDTIITVLVSVSDAPSASGYYDVEVTSAGAAGLGFQQAPSGGTKPKARGRITVNGNPNLSLQLLSNGIAVSPIPTGGAVTSMNCAYITPTLSHPLNLFYVGAVMPRLTLSVVPNNQNTLVTGPATYQLTTTFNRLNGPSTFVTDKTVVPQSSPLQTAQAGEPAVLDLNLLTYPNAFGGHATISWTYDGKAQPDFNFLICGKNPDPLGPDLDTVFNDATSSVGNRYWFAKNIAIHETSERQFYEPGIYASCNTNPSTDLKTPGFPLCGFPAGYGLMQLDQTRSPLQLSSLQLWDWTQNILGGLNLLESNANPAPGGQSGYTFWKEQVRQWQEYNAVQSAGNRVGPPPDEVLPGCRFTFTQAPAPDYSAPVTGVPGAYWYGDAVLMKNYAGTGVAGANYISWNSTQGNTANGKWSTNRQSLIGHNPAYEFCSCSTSAGCQRQTPSQYQ